MRAVRLLPVLAIVLTACTGGSNGAVDGGACDAAGYPCGPYGLAPGSTIANLSIPGKRDQNHSGDVLDDPVLPITFADYHGTPGLRALLIVIGTETCVPCQNEQPDLLALHSRYAASGALAILEAIVQGQAGKPADTAVLDAWVTRYQVPFDMTADPTSALQPYYSSAAFPSSLLIRVADMSLVSVVTGPLDAAAEASIDAVAR